MRIFIILFIVATLVPAFGICQNTFEMVFGDVFDETGNAVLQTPDSGFILCGYSSSFPYKYEDVYIVRTDSTGHILWEKNYGSTRDERSYSINPTLNGGFIIAAEYFNETINKTRAYLLRIDENGDTLWTRKFAGNGTANAVARDALETEDGGFILCGASHDGENRGIFILKTDAEGEALWSKIITTSTNDWSFDMKKTMDGGYIFCGGTETEPGYDDFFIVKTDANGDTIWTRHYGYAGYDAAYSIIQSDEGEYYVTGNAWDVYEPNAFDILVIKLNEQGDSIWTRRYGGYDGEFAYSIDFTNDGNIVIGGRTRTFGSGNFDMYILKIDTAGNLLWSQTYGGAELESCYAAHPTFDNGLIINGYTTSYGSGGADIYFLKTNADGLLTGIHDPNHNLKRLNIWPNPSTGNFFITLKENRGKLKIFNGLGVLVYENDIYMDTPDLNFHINLERCSKGIYFITFSGKSPSLWSQKLLIQ